MRLDDWTQDDQYKQYHVITEIIHSKTGISYVLRVNELEKLRKYNEPMGARAWFDETNTSNLLNLLNEFFSGTLLLQNSTKR